MARTCSKCGQRAVVKALGFGSWWVCESCGYTGEPVKEKKKKKRKG